jgi:class 3 adenylate cyclase
MAMGLARLRAEHLHSRALQIVVWDGKPASGPAGTGADVAAWSLAGEASRTIAPGGADRAFARPGIDFESPYERVLAAILFTDFVGFSKLPETALPAFWDGVMRVVAEVLDDHAGDVSCRNSWGDALYAVSESAPAAAEIALDLQSRLAAYDYAALGLDGSGGMRVGAHYGSVYRTIDRITGRTTFYGTEVSRAARIEPVTPPGAVFVTEPLAAILALEARGAVQLLLCRPDRARQELRRLPHVPPAARGLSNFAYFPAIRGDGEAIEAQAGVQSGYRLAKKGG